MNKGEFVSSVPNERTWTIQALSWTRGRLHTKGIFLCQQKYANDLLQKFGMLECKPISTLMEPNAKMCVHEGRDLEDAAMYQQFVGSLIYLILTRPDISCEIGVMSQYMQNPKKPHLDHFDEC